MVKAIFPIEQMPDIFSESAIVDAEKQQYVVLGTFGRGDMFGAQSALNDMPNPMTIFASTKKLEYYKIHRSHF